jgi:hypothetical protein
VRAQQRGVDPLPLRLRQHGEELIGDVRKEIREPGERELRLGFGRTREHDP